jgi:hypothetical protein
MRPDLVATLVVALSASAATVFSPSQGGTGTGTKPLAGKVLIGTSGSVYTPAYLTAGSNITIATSSGGITISASSGVATTTINGVSGPTFTFNIAGTNGLSYSTSTGVVTLTQATSTDSVAGFLSAADHTTFNAKVGTGVTTLSSLASIGTITTGVWNGSVVGPAYGGTGVANNALSTLTISGNFGTTLTVSGTTNVTLPTSGTLATTAQYQAASTLEKNLVAYFPMDFSDVNGVSVYDAALARNTATTTGTIFTATTGPDSNGSFSFDAVDDYIEIPHHVNQLLVNGFSISAWIKPTSTGEGGVGAILTKETGTSGEAGWRYALTGTAAISMKVNNGTTVSSNSNAYVVNDGNWYHVVVTVSSAATVTHYINGVANGTPAATGALSGITTTGVARIGNRSSGTDQTFDGSIAKVRLYARVLSTAEITELYTNKL